VSGNRVAWKLFTRNSCMSIQEGMEIISRGKSCIPRQEGRWDGSLFA